MAKTFSTLVGWVLVIVGLLNFFHTGQFGFDIHLLPAHGVFHIVAGLLGVWAAKDHAAGYAMWVGIVGVVLAVAGFLGLHNVLNLINLPTWISVIHAVLGVWGLWTYWAGAKGGMASAGSSV